MNNLCGGTGLAAQTGSPGVIHSLRRGPRRNWSAASKIIFLVLILIGLQSGPLLGADKNIVVHLVPTDSGYVQTNWIRSVHQVRQYNQQHQLIGTTKNSNSVSKTMLRLRPLPNLCLGLDAVYFPQRDQTAYNHVSGKARSVYADSGFGDTSLLLYYQPYDSRKQFWGLALGADLLLPSGAESRGLGKGNTEFSLQSTLSLRSRIGFPYVVGIYTWIDDGGREGKTPDELMFGLGFKSKPWREFQVDALLFNHFQCSNEVKYKDQVPYRITRYNTPGYRVAMKYFLRKNLEISLFWEQSRQQDHLSISPRDTLSLEPDSRRRYGLSLRYIWP